MQQRPQPLGELPALSSLGTTWFNKKAKQPPQGSNQSIAVQRAEHVHEVKSIKPYTDPMKRSNHSHLHRVHCFPCIPIFVSNDRTAPSSLGNRPPRGTQERG